MCVWSSTNNLKKDKNTMNIQDFETTFAGLKQSDKITIKCDHPDCLIPEKIIGREAAKRNILKNGGEKFICGNCDKRFNNPMNKIGQGKKALGEIDVVCPNCNKFRKINSSCYFGILSEPYVQICGSCAQIGKKITEEQKQKISQTLTGRNLTEDHKKNISKYMKYNLNGIEQGKRNLIPGSGGGWNKGSKTPKEVCEKQSLAMLGRTYSDEHKANISAGRKKHLDEVGGFSLEHRQRIREATLKQYERGFNPNAHHRNGYHISPKCEKAFYRSSYEKKAFMILDEMENVKNYEVEKIRIPYWNPLEKTQAIFIVDVIVELNDGSKMVIEIKPMIWINSLVNTSKIDALKLWSEKENMTYEIWNEFKLFGEENTNQEIQKFIDWIDSGATGKIDNITDNVVNLRKEKSCDKTKKFYKNNLSNKIILFCEFCQKQHEVREITYKQHLEKYGKYKCFTECGVIGGSKPKPKKENPHASDGKKECNRCKEIKNFEEFGLDKFKSDGYATICRPCRSNKSKDDYFKKTKNISE